MGLTRKDAAATMLTALVLLVFLATHEGWDVWLIGSSHRWAAGAVLCFGMITCSLGSQSRGAMSRWLAVLGIAALVLAVFAIATGSLTLLSLLVVDIVVLWAASTRRHVRHVPRKAAVAGR